MNTMFFVTPGRLDMRAITVFGLSAKKGENPIGFFGTGLKYAIAILMREGAQFHIETGGVRYDFDVNADTFRDKEFSCIGMHSALKGYELPFTTELGKNWEMWQAFRELYCNTKDEGGLTQERIAAIPEVWGDDYTIISVHHKDFYDAYCNRHKFFIENKQPIASGDSMEVYEGESLYQFYRGIRVGELPHKSLYTWNYTYSIDLTEDRTCKYSFVWESPAAGVIAYANNKMFIRNCVTAPNETFEAKLDYGLGMAVSSEFMDVMAQFENDYSGGVSHSARKLYEHKAQKQLGEKDAVALTKIEQAMLDKAITVCADLGCKPNDCPIIVTQSLGNNVLGLSSNGKVYLSKEVFNMGTKMVAGTLYEELLHHEQRMWDMTRQFQNFLINKLMSMYEEQKGEPM